MNRRSFFGRTLTALAAAALPFWPRAADAVEHTSDCLPRTISHCPPGTMMFRVVRVEAGRSDFYRENVVYSDGATPTREVFCYQRGKRIVMVPID